MKVEGGEVVKVRTGHYLPKWVAVSRQGSGFKIGFQACVRSSKTGSKFGLPFWIRVWKRALFSNWSTRIHLWSSTFLHRKTCVCVCRLLMIGAFCVRVCAFHISKHFSKAGWYIWLVCLRMTDKHAGPWCDSSCLWVTRWICSQKKRKERSKESWLCFSYGIWVMEVLKLNTCWVLGSGFKEG